MKQNLNCSGSTRVDGGEYGEVRVSASLRVDGDLRCDTLQCSGSAKIEGALSCAGEVRCSGSVKVAGEAAMQEGRFSGSVKAQSLHCTGTLQCSGSAKTEGGMQLGKARFSGSCAAEGDIHAEELEIAGSLRAPAVEAERFHASGVFRIDGLLNAGEIILSRGGLYQAGDIGCTTLRVVQDAHVISLGPPQARTGGPVHRGRHARAARYAGGRRPRALCLRRRRLRDRPRGVFRGPDGRGRRYRKRTGPLLIDTACPA